jgi:type VI secretion system secreted protein Hcp
MAVDMFIKLHDIQGESKDKTHKGETDVLAWSWGMSQSGTFHTGGGGGAGKVNVQDLSFTKWVDKTSAALMLLCCNGRHMDECLLTVRKAGDTPLEYLKIRMEKVMVTSVSTGGSGGEDQLSENVTLNFAKVNVDYMEQLDDGSGQQAGNLAWDIEANCEA